MQASLTSQRGGTKIRIMVYTRFVAASCLFEEINNNGPSQQFSDGEAKALAGTWHGPT